jgi:hypothetical protein
MELGPEPQRLECPECKHDILTQTNGKVTDKGKLISLMLCLIGW